MRGSSSREQEVIERQVSHLVRLVDDLLDISRITSGKVTLKTQSMELVDIVKAAVETASPLFQQRSQRLLLEVPPQGLVVSMDPGRMVQVLSNLLTNASKYSGEVGLDPMSRHSGKATRPFCWFAMRCRHRP